jgi:hypothetical protein
MLAMPDTGMGYSVKKHNVKLDVICDWLEGSTLFADEEALSQSEVVDVLLEEEVYREQDFAWEMTQNAWGELIRRQYGIAEGASFSISSNRITRRRSWQDACAHSFCVLLALAKWYTGWAKQFGSDYIEQGELFEKLTKESLELQFSGWKIYQTGWSRTSPKKLADVVDEVTNQLGESKGDLKTWAKPFAHEAGLDLLCYRPFPDGRVGVPVYLMQCASGGDWEDKLHTPDLKVWKKIVLFAARPMKAFATPFAFLDDDFRRNCNVVDGMLLDRYRLLAACSSDNDWVSEQLRERIITWANPRITALRRGDNR